MIGSKAFCSSIMKNTSGAQIHKIKTSMLIYDDFEKRVSKFFLCPDQKWNRCRGYLKMLKFVQRRISNIPMLNEFIKNQSMQNEKIDKPADVPYLTNDFSVNNRKVFMETYGCQMNFSDTEIVLSVLNSAGYKQTTLLEEADVIFLMTCSIRENAETKIWNRLDYFKSMKRKDLKVGILGCMAERLKNKLLETDKMVDIVCGPDAYRDLPRLLSTVETGSNSGINVLLSLDETYADITPVRLSKDSRSAFVSIMRGCDNMCSYCIVPFTRGKERSRPVSSILKEIKELSLQGVKEVTLLGQNVNSYRDLTEESSCVGSSNSDGFKTIYKPKEGGLRFTELLDRASLIDPEMRIRFTSPHPKDFPDDLLHLIAKRPNICKCIHLPVQSGSSAVLDKMRRGYSRESYLNLVKKIREIMPHVSLTSDFISGFCGETDEDHEQTISLMKLVGYDMAYMFAYSMREKTSAHRNLIDDVSEEVKQKRLSQVIATFHETSKVVSKRFIGTEQLVLVEGSSKKSESDWSGRTDGNRTTVFPKIPVRDKDLMRDLKEGDYVVVSIESTTGSTLIGKPLYVSSIMEFCGNK